MRLHSLINKGHKKNVRRVGRGSGCGSGKTSGRGHKGAGQRKGRTHYIGFEGGNVPYLRKIPKRGFTPGRRREFQVVNISDIASRCQGVKEITPQYLKEKGLIRDDTCPVKILARAATKVAITAKFKADMFSRKARMLIEKGGGKAECLNR